MSSTAGHLGLGFQEDKYRRPHELPWINLYSWLLHCGYQLRRRYEPDWVPSWLDGRISKRMAEDNVAPAYPKKIMDAVRTCDETQVVLKFVPTKTKEITYLKHFNTPTMLVDQRNPVVPLLEVVPLPQTDEEALVVMPLLRQYNDPPFETLGEILVCIRSLMDGLAFLHQSNLAHLDIAWANTMMLPSSRMYPRKFHPASHEKPAACGRDLLEMQPGGAVYTSRTLAPCRYYFVDLGTSVMFPSSYERERMTGRVGHDVEDVPDFLLEDWDPFELDIRKIGDMLHEDIISEREDLDVLLPFVEALRADDPALRPPATYAVKMLDDIVNTLTQSQLFSSPLPKPGIPYRISTFERSVHRCQALLLQRSPLYTWEKEVQDETRDDTSRLKFIKRLWRQLVLAHWWTSLAMITKG